MQEQSEHGGAKTKSMWLACTICQSCLGCTDSSQVHLAQGGGEGIDDWHEKEAVELELHRLHQLVAYACACI